MDTALHAREGLNFLHKDHVTCHRHATSVSRSACPAGPRTKSHPDLDVMIHRSLDVMIHRSPDPARATHMPSRASSADMVLSIHLIVAGGGSVTGCNVQHCLLPFLDVRTTLCTGCVPCSLQFLTHEHDRLGPMWLAHMLSSPCPSDVSGTSITQLNSLLCL